MSHLPSIAPSAIAIYLVAMFALLTFVSACAERGPDHFFYQYYVECIRTNRRRLLSRFPNFVNSTRVMDPQLIYLCLSFLPRRANDACALLLNPTVTIAMLAAFYLGVREITHDDRIAAAATVLTSLTPQFYFIWNSRLHGLSGRGVGMFLFWLLALVGFHCTSHGALDWQHMLAGSAIACAILFSSIFALQGVCLIGVTMALLFGEFFLLGSLCGGLVMFFAIDRRYAALYISGLIGYWNRYRTEFAARFIFLQRPSVYRDFARDFYVRLFRRPGKFGALLYIYTNPIIMVLLLSPVPVLASCVAWIAYTPLLSLSPLEKWALQLTAAATVVCFATAFRVLRFLGEPDRYIELVCPFAVLTIVMIATRLEWAGLMVAMLLYFVAADLCQASVSFLLKRHARATNSSRARSLNALRGAIKASASDRDVILTGNDGNTITSLLNTDWRFVHYWPSEATFAGFSLSEAFPRFPCMSSPVLSELTQRFGVTHVVINKLDGVPLPNDLAGSFQRVFCDEQYELWQRC